MPPDETIESEVDEAEDLPPPKDAREFILRCLSKAGVTEEDFGATPGQLGFFDTKGAGWEFLEGVPGKGSQTILYIAREEGERRIYSAPFARPRMSPQDNAMLQNDFKTGKAYCICWHLTALGVDMVSMDVDAMISLVAKEIRAAVDDFFGDSEFEDILAYLKGLPTTTSLAAAIKGLEDEEHLEEVGEPVAAPPNGAASKQTTATS